MTPLLPTAVFSKNGHLVIRMTRWSCQVLSPHSTLISERSVRQRRLQERSAEFSAQSIHSGRCVWCVCVPLIACRRHDVVIGSCHYVGWPAKDSVANIFRGRLPESMGTTENWLTLGAWLDKKVLYKKLKCTEDIVCCLFSQVYYSEYKDFFSPFFFMALPIGDYKYLCASCRSCCHRNVRAIIFRHARGPKNPFQGQAAPPHSLSLFTIVSLISDIGLLTNRFFQLPDSIYHL